MYYTSIHRRKIALYFMYGKKVNCFIPLSKFTKVCLMCFDILTIHNIIETKQRPQKTSESLQLISKSYFLLPFHFYILFTLLFTLVLSLLVTVLHSILSQVLCFIGALCLQRVMWSVYVMSHVSFAFPSLHAKCKQALCFCAWIHASPQW